MPAGWAVISITILNAHKKKGHGAYFRCPISRKTGHLAAILFVDDNDLLHIDMDTDQTVEDAHYDLQSSVSSWGKLLIASGGSLKPEKCFFYLISFKWNKEGKWSYAANEEEEEYRLGVPLPDGSEAEIEHLAVDVAKETLGVWTCPSGDASAQFRSMKEKGQKWIDRARESHLQQRDIWFLLEHQLWPRLGYGICSIAAPWKKLEHCLKRIWWQLLPLGGVVRSASRELRQMSREFYGVGCPHPGVECFVQQVNKLHVHYGCDSNLELKVSTSIEMLIVEMGVSAQPFQESFLKYKDWVTWSWMVSLWEKCDLLDVEIELDEIF